MSLPRFHCRVVWLLSSSLFSSSLSFVASSSLLFGDRLFCTLLSWLSSLLFLLPCRSSLSLCHPVSGPFSPPVSSSTTSPPSVQRHERCHPPPPSDSRCRTCTARPTQVLRPAPVVSHRPTQVLRPAPVVSHRPTHYGVARPAPPPSTPFPPRPSQCHPPPSALLSGTSNALHPLHSMLHGSYRVEGVDFHHEVTGDLGKRDFFGFCDFSCLEQPVNPRQKRVPSSAQPFPPRINPDRLRTFLLSPSPPPPPSTPSLQFFGPNRSAKVNEETERSFPFPTPSVAREEGCSKIPSPGNRW